MLKIRINFHIVRKTRPYIVNISPLCYPEVESSSTKVRFAGHTLTKPHSSTLTGMTPVTTLHHYLCNVI